jgi:GT2 family glycosyltransferase
MSSAPSGVTVVVPVFNAFEVLEACLAALQSCSPQARVLLVDDASTDARVAPALAEFAAAWEGRRVLTLAKNRGFVHAANQGMAAATGHPVLLNSDTVVTHGWLEALARCLASDSRIATATPWSNNAEIVSVPHFCAANPVPRDPQAWADAARDSAGQTYPELPTAVGFCMAVRQEALQSLGGFDEAVFGRGYGEENDFCRRAAKAGWRNVLCDDAYVVHVGGQSFGPLGLRPDESSMARLLERHPEYLDEVSAWIKADPLAKRRAALLEARERNLSPAGGSGTLIPSPKDPES